PKPEKWIRPHLVGCCSACRRPFLVAAQVPRSITGVFQPATSIKSLSLMPPAQHDTGECVPQVVTNIYGGLGLPTRRRFTFPLPYAGREQVAPAGTCRAAPSEVERQPARLFWYWVSFPLSELCSRVGSFRVRTKRSRFSAQNEVSRSPV